MSRIFATSKKGVSPIHARRTGRVFNTKSLFHVASLAVCVLFLVTGCVTQPYNHQVECPGFPIDVRGFAHNPNATIRVEAFNFSTNSWQAVQTTVSSSSGVTLSGDTLYTWRATATLGYEHYTPFTPDAEAQLRVKEIGGLLNYLVTFEKDGIKCVLDKMADGVSWLSAGFQCRSEHSPTIHLVCIG